MKNHNNFYKEYIKQLNKQYPCTGVQDLLLPAVSPFIISINQKTVDKIKNIVKILYKMAHLKKYADLIKTDYKMYLDTKVADSSVLMSYDFHLDSQDNLKLIEVNTQSSGYLLSDLVDQVHKINSYNNFTSTQILKQSFENEWNCFSGSSTPPKNTLIIDNQIKSQKMYMEFLMYKELFKKWGWACELHEAEELNINNKGFLVDRDKNEVQMVYNRCTDFYFQNLPYLKKVFLNQKSCISAHPREYILLSDKMRLCEWSSSDFLDSLDLSKEDKQQIKDIVPFSSLVSCFSAEELWRIRKQFFFKPLNKYGGKSVYRGKNISHNIFNRVIKEAGMVQQLIPPKVFIDSDNIKWKYDIRVYVYKNRVQKLSARVYQGQITQFKTPLSGIASINIL